MLRHFASLSWEGKFLLESFLIPFDSPLPLIDRTFRCILLPVTVFCALFFIPGSIWVLLHMLWCTFNNYGGLVYTTVYSLASLWQSSRTPYKNTHRSWSLCFASSCCMYFCHMCLDCCFLLRSIFAQLVLASRFRA
jgi:hypothetical protein